jgi:hypothetical protein
MRQGDVLTCAAQNHIRPAEQWNFAWSCVRLQLLISDVYTHNIPQAMEMSIIYFHKILTKCTTFKIISLVNLFPSAAIFKLIWKINKTSRFGDKMSSRLQTKTITPTQLGPTCKAWRSGLVLSPKCRVLFVFYSFWIWKHRMRGKVLTANELKCLTL